MGLDITQKIFVGLATTSGITSLVSVSIAAKNLMEGLNASNVLPYVAVGLGSTGISFVSACIYNLYSRDIDEIKRRNRSY